MTDKLGDDWVEIGTTDPNSKVWLAPKGTRVIHTTSPMMHFDETHFFAETGDLYPPNGGHVSLKDLAMKHKPDPDWWDRCLDNPEPITFTWPMTSYEQTILTLYGISAAKAELLWRLNETWSGRDPGKPKCWKGL